MSTPFRNGSVFDCLMVTLTRDGDLLSSNAISPAVERKREGEWEVGEGDEEEEVPPNGSSEKEGKEEFPPMPMGSIGGEGEGEFLPMPMGGIGGGGEGEGRGTSCRCQWAV